MLNIGVVGVGVWGCHSLEQSLSAIGRGRVRAVTTCERWGAHHFEGDAVRFGRQYAEDRDAEFIADWHELVHRPDIDLVSVMVCPRHKADVIAEALRAGKHIVTDKPLAMNAGEAARLVRLEARSAARGFMLAGYQTRPLVSRLAAAIASGRLGRIKAVDIRLCFMGGIYPGFIPTRRWRSEIPSGELTTIGSHALVTLMKLHQAPIDGICARIDNRFYRQYADAGAEDWAEANLTFADGAVASIMVARLPYNVPDEDMVIHVTGADGYAQIENQTLTIWPNKATVEDENGENALHAVLHAAADAFEQGTEPPVTFCDGWKLQCVLDAALESAGQNRQEPVTWPTKIVTDQP